MIPCCPTLCPPPANAGACHERAEHQQANKVYPKSSDLISTTSQVHTRMFRKVASLSAKSAAWTQVSRRALNANLQAPSVAIAAASSTFADGDFVSQVCPLIQFCM